VKPALPPRAIGRDLAEEVRQLQIAALRQQPLDRIAPRSAEPGTALSSLLIIGFPCPGSTTGPSIDMAASPPNGYLVKPYR
jgi:hypothetical protein